eukprot:TRINITY_DN68138_c0_g1_i1.p1 TRINITY_DN68138_c0_g1~~TRINITY_DN68138_c0_g1_i1.p1  ORF type:complete len:1002 (-),score=166.98 TRINITY_DN68138_c0_g1_i1:75-3080(-)
MALGGDAMTELATLLGQSLVPGPHMTQATERLRSGEASAGFGLVLLRFLQDDSVAVGGTKQAAAIYFKNFIRRCWSKEASMGGVPSGDRELVKEHLVSLMVHAARPVQVQLCAALEEISLSEFPENWQGLLPELVRHISTSQDVRIWTGAMEMASTIFTRFRAGAWRENLLQEVRYCVSEFGVAHLQLFKTVSERLISGGLVDEQLRVHAHLLHIAAEAFQDLNSAILTDFFKENCSTYFEAFVALLGFGCRCLAGSVGVDRAAAGTLTGTSGDSALGNAAADEQSPLYLLMGQICDNMSLYSDRHSDEFQPFLSHCVKAVWELLVALGNQDHGDHLASRGMNFLASVAVARSTSTPFSDTAALQAICERVVLPNLQLRAPDLELFEENPVEYLRREVEGADQDTRRRSARELVRALRRFYDTKVTEILVPYVNQMLEQSKVANPAQAELCRDACFCLITALAGGALVCDAEGVPRMSHKQDIIKDFFGTQVVPELQAEAAPPRNISRAACLKYIHVFRSQLSVEQVLAVLPAVARHVLATNPVLHTYGAVCIASLCTIEDRTEGGRRSRYDLATLQPVLLQLVSPILQILFEGRGIAQNEHLAAALKTILGSLGKIATGLGSLALQKLAQIVTIAAINTANPDYVHNIFECVALAVKAVIPEEMKAIDEWLLPVLGKVVEQDITDFLPYTFQILGLLLDLTDGVNEMYAGLLPRLMEERFWQARGNVPALLRLLRAYYVKYQIFAVGLQNSMPALFQCFQLMLGHRQLESVAFGLLHAKFRHLPFELYQQYLPSVFSVVLARLQAKKTPELEKNFVLALSLLVHMHPDVNLVPSLFNHIQPGLFRNFMEHVWLPNTRHWVHHRRKVCVLGLSKLMNHPEICDDPSLLQACCDNIISTLRWKRTDLVKWWIEAFKSVTPTEEDEQCAGREYQVCFNKLQNAELGEQGSRPGESVLGDLVPEIRDAQAVGKAVRGALAPLRPRILQLGECMKPLVAEPGELQ